MICPVSMSLTAFPVFHCDAARKVTSPSLCHGNELYTKTLFPFHFTSAASSFNCLFKEEVTTLSAANTRSLFSFHDFSIGSYTPAALCFLNSSPYAQVPFSQWLMAMPKVCSLKRRLFS